MLLAMAALAYLIFPRDLGFLTTIAVYCILALSYSFIFGQAGIASMGHATLYGVSAYGAGLLALHVSTDPLVGLLFGAFVGAVTAFLTALLFIRTTGLTLAMLTIAVAQVVHEIANKAAWLTGGDDGLTGFQIAPLLGLFNFDLFGNVGYWYAIVVLVLVFGLLRWIVAAPFGLTCRAIREDRGRAESMGCNVLPHLIKTYCVAGAIAGLAGALNAQIAGVVSLNSLSFSVSTNVLVMVVLGGTFELGGAIIGAIVFLLVQHVASTVNPYNWLFVIGALLIGVMVLLPAGLIGLWRRVVEFFYARNEKNA